MASVNGGIELCYEDWGDEAAEPILLIMGLSAQMLVRAAGDSARWRCVAPVRWPSARPSHPSQ